MSSAWVSNKCLPLSSNGLESQMEKGQGLRPQTPHHQTLGDSKLPHSQQKFPLTKLLHKQEPFPFFSLHSSNGSTISLGTRTLAHNFLFHKKASTTKRTCSWNSPSSHQKAWNKCCFQLIKQTRKKNQISQGQNNHFREHPAHMQIYGALPKFSRCSSDQHTWKEQFPKSFSVTAVLGQAALWNLLG